MKFCVNYAMRGHPQLIPLDEPSIYFLINHDHFHLYDSLFPIKELSFLIYYLISSMLKTCTHTHTHMYKHIQYIQTHKYETVSSSTNCKEEIWNNAVLYF